MYNILYDKTSGEIIELSYGNSEYQHRLNQGYFLLKVSDFEIEGKNSKRLKVDILTQKIVLKTEQEYIEQQEIETEEERKRDIIKLSLEREKAIDLGYSDLANKYNKIIKKNSER